MTRVQKKQKKKEMMLLKKRQNKRKFQKSIPLLVMLIPAILYYIIFRIAPMFGLVMAFQDYKLSQGLFGSKFIGLTNFLYIFKTPVMLRVIRNTLVLGLLSFVISFPFPILLALFLNETKNVLFKKSVQTMVYLPHFLSWVAVGGLVFTIFAQEDGIVNNMLQALGGKAYPFLYHVGSWIAIFLGAGIWKETGFAAIIYLAALGGIDPTLYEAASLDGCPRWKQMFYVSIPCIAPTIIINLVLKAGAIATVGFDQIYNLKTAPVSEIAEVISTWTYQMGLHSLQFSLSSAMGLFNSLLSLTLVLLTNSIAKRFDKSLW